MYDMNKKRIFFSGKLLRGKMVHTLEWGAVSMHIPI